MHPDKKVGLALGILLIGITGAFFFRNEVPDADDDAQLLADVDRIDQQIRHRSGSPSPYLPSPGTDTAQPTDLADVPDSPVDGVVPMAPETSVVVPVPLPDPIRPLGESDSDRVIPVPFPSTDVAVVDAALSRTGAGAGSVKGSATGKQPAGRPATSGTSEKKPGAVQSGSTVGSLAATPVAEPKLYEVQPGDTLSRISEEMLGTHRRFRELFEANRDILDTPDDLRPGMKLRLPGTNEPSVARASAPGFDSPSKRPGATLSSEPLAGDSGDQDSGTPPSPVGTNGPIFVRPSKTPGVPGRRTTLKTDSKSPARSLSQTAPPGVPIVRDFPVGKTATVIATRSDDESAASTKSTQK